MFSHCFFFFFVLCFDQFPRSTIWWRRLRNDSKLGITAVMLSDILTTINFNRNSYNLRFWVEFQTKYETGSNVYKLQLAKFKWLTIFELIDFTSFTYVADMRGLKRLALVRSGHVRVYFIYFFSSPSLSPSRLYRQFMYGHQLDFFSCSKRDFLTCQFQQQLSRETP